MLVRCQVSWNGANGNELTGSWQLLTQARECELWSAQTSWVQLQATTESLLSFKGKQSKRQQHEDTFWLEVTESLQNGAPQLHMQRLSSDWVSHG